MPTYQYEARRPSGDLVSGTEDADDRAQLRHQLSRRGLLLVEATADRQIRLSGVGRARVPLPVLLAFVREFRHMIAAGLPVTEALSILEDRQDSARLATAVAGLRERIEKGVALDEAAADFPDVFDQVFRASLRAGALSSQLPLVLERMEALLALRAETRRKIRQALAYPVFLSGLLAVVLGILFLFVLPRFAELYAEFDAELPRATRVLMRAVETAPVWVPAGAAALIGGYLLWRAALTRPSVRAAVDGALLKLPAAGKIVRDIQLVQVAQVTAMLLRAGTPLKDALDFVADTGSNARVRADAAKLVQAINDGRSLSDGIAETGLFPPTSRGMIRAGERSGSLAELLEAVATMHEQSADERLRRLLTLVEPAMMLAVGLVLGTILIVVYLPIFGIAGVVR